MPSSVASSDLAVSVRGLSKSYTIAHESQKHTLASEALLHGLRNIGKKSTSETFWALQDVSFEINKGDVVGIIGRNGAGKSTLLKVLSRITEPTAGKIDLYGRVGSLLEVGTGFHPELTGRENVYLNGAILGMSKREIASHFDAIVEFAEVEKFLDTPVKRYSSGMYVRLAFAVAAHLNPEILIVDEVLAVGDVAFQKKCLGKMQDVASHGRTVIFVSHNMAAVRQLCRSGIVLEAGRVRYIGDISKSIEVYSDQGVQGQSIISQLAKPHPDLIIEDVLINGSPSSQVQISDDVRILEIEFIGHLSAPARVEMEAALTDTFDVRLGYYSPGHERGATEILPSGRFHLVRQIELPQRINKGEYLLHLFLTEPDVKYWVQLPRAVRLISEGTPTATGRTLEYHSGGGWLHLTSPEIMVPRGETAPLTEEKRRDISLSAL